MAAETDTGFQRSPWLFLLGAVVFLGSIALFVYDLASGNNPVRGIAANAAAAALVLALAGLETLSDPESHIETRGEAVRAVLLFYGLYLVGTGVTVLGGSAISRLDPRLGAAGIAAGGVIVTLLFLLGGAETGLRSRLSTFTGFLGLVLVVVSVGLFVYDIATGRDVLRGIVVNGVGAALFILWTAYDMPSDPDSGVDTAPDALGVSLLFYGGYLLAAGAAVAVTGLVAHERDLIGFLYLALAVLPLVLGFLLAPLGELTETADDVQSDDEQSGADTDG